MNPHPITIDIPKMKHRNCMLFLQYVDAFLEKREMNQVPREIIWSLGTTITGSIINRLFYCLLFCLRGLQRNSSQIAELKYLTPNVTHFAYNRAI